MNKSKLTIRWMRNDDGCTDISVCGEVNSIARFKEAFTSLDNPIPIYDIHEDKAESESGANSATTTLLSNLRDIIYKSIKTDGHLVSEKERNKTFIFSDLIAIRKFAEIAGIEFDESKFSNRREFQWYFENLLK